MAETKAEFDQLNARSFEYKALKQEADSDKGLYEELVRKIKEAGINSSFQNSSIRLADSARPALKPVFPDLQLNAILALLFSTLLAVGLAVLADTLDNTVRDPEDIQKTLRTEVLGSLPDREALARPACFVFAWRRNGTHGPGQIHGAHTRRSRRLKKPSGRCAIPSCFPISAAARARLLITSATPREGKTTASVHLAIAHSLQKRKTLLIDADLRRPGIHTRLDMPNERGLSNVIKGEAGWRDVLQNSKDYPDLDILSAGPASRHAADQVGGVLEKLLAEAEPAYDLVMIDAPPYWDSQSRSRWPRSSMAW